jgi:hypothetical protein
MSGSLATIASGLGVAAVRSIANILFRPQRGIAFVVPHCVVAEDHYDGLEVTEHPVETGSAINDHAFMRPAEVRITAKWSNADLRALLGISLSENYGTRVYAQLVDLQRSRIPFRVTTGKRTYDSMLLTELSVNTTRESEYGLDAQITCRQINIVSTTVVAVTPREAQAVPEQTQGVSDTGVRQPVAVPQQSILRSLSGVLGRVVGAI